MSQHTRGPWEFRTYSEGCVVVSKHDATGRSVRDRLKGVRVLVEAQIDDDQSNAHEASADARLIVAAPEMLAALEAALEGLERDGQASAIASLNTLGRRAVAKATGTVND